MGFYKFGFDKVCDSLCLPREIASKKIVNE